MPETAPFPAYPPTMKTIHWTTAALIITLLILGWTMTDNPGLSPGTRAALYGWHKSLGVLVLLVTCLRIVWRGGHRPPPLPPTLLPWELMAVGIVHRLFYVLLVLQPLTGWTIYSMSSHKSLFFGLMRIPNLPFIPQVAPQAPIMTIMEGTHATLASLLAILLVVHVGAAFKHHFMARDDVLLRMVPAVFVPWLDALRGQRRR